MSKSPAYYIIFIFFFVFYSCSFTEFVKSEVLIDSNINNTNSWFGIEGISGIFTGNYNSTSNNIFEGFNEIPLFSKPEQKKNNSWIPKSLSGVISRLDVNSKKEPSLKDKFSNLKEYFWKHSSNNEKKSQNGPTERSRLNIPSFNFGWKNGTNIEKNESVENKASKEKNTAENDNNQKGIIQIKKSDEITDSGSQSDQTSQNAILNQECERNVISGFRECIERCKSGLKLIQARTGGITPMNLSEFNTCIQNCRRNANSMGCRLSNSSIKIINEEIPIPKPTIRRNHNKNDSSHGLFYIYFVEPILKFFLTLLFIIVGIIVVLYYFKDYRLYPKFADYITSTIEAFYTEDEKRRAIFEGDCFPQQPTQNWKRTIIYFIRLNFLPRFFVTSFAWLIPMRDHYQQTVESSNYIRIH
ncbi:hypothetical protein FG379_003179 [Cryptosporidium bovis]|uniref:uncharacterized protein n=1 Tax=Cryptosporidium bovis TaxID=310047 RepID=UPI003519F683|nr:hypothetical protein FG379_003179 [Cryptosporidium bovis]